MSTKRKHQHTATELQGRAVARWNREQQTAPDRANPKTTTERQVAALLAEPDDDKR